MTDKRALIFANGSVRDGAFVRRALEMPPEPLIVAADGGARMASSHFDLTPDMILGDLDSLSDDEIASFRARGVPVQEFPQEKDETDLEIAFKWTAEQGIDHIRVIGALGRRIDQTFGNIYLLALPELATVDTRLVSDDQQIWLGAPGEHTVEGQPGDTLSLIPISENVVNIHTDGLYYPLTGDTLYFGPARGISNVLNTDCATVHFDSGRLLFVHTLGHAE